MAADADIFKFRSRFPEFDYDIIGDPDIADALDFALLWIDPLVWSPTDFPHAVLLWSAHMLSLKQIQLASTQLGGTGETDLFVGSISFGERRVMFRQRRGMSSKETGTGPGEALLSETIYGQMYLMLRNRNITPVAIV